MVHQHGPIKLWCYSFSLCSSSFWLWLLVSTCTVATVQGTCTVALRGYLFPPIIRNIHHTRDMMFASELPEKKRSLAFMGKSRNKTGKFLLPHLTFFCTSTIARDGAGLGFFSPFLPTAVHAVQHHCLSASTDCETKMNRLCRFVSGCHLCLTQRLLLSLGDRLPTLLSCFTHAVTGTALITALRADLKVPKTQPWRMHPNSPL